MTPAKYIFSLGHFCLCDHIAVLASTDRIKLNLIRMECNHYVWLHFGLLRILFNWMLGQKGPLWLIGNHLVEIIKFTGSTLF